MFAAFGELAAARGSLERGGSGTFFAPAAVVSFSEAAPLPLGFVRVQGRESEAVVKVPGMPCRESEANLNGRGQFGFASLLSLASPHGLSRGCEAELGFVAAWLFEAPVAGGSAEAVSHTPNRVLKNAPLATIGRLYH